jgi:predicted dehydrogenase
MNVGIIGCGNISDIYLQNCKRLSGLNVIACADLVEERARDKAARYGVPKALTPDALAADPDVELAINLTVPRAHFDVARQLVAAGKHVYNEKPLSTVRSDAKKLLDDARAAHLRIGCAPDTFLGAALQTARKRIDAGEIGKPVGATAFMTSHGVEGWHPDPEFFFKPGAGPLLDMGPYYLTAMISLIGPVRRVSASTAASFPERIVVRGPKAGQRIAVETPTHVSASLEFEAGAIATVLFSFDVWAAHLPFIEIYGTEGTMSLPDPNFFGGVVRVLRAGDHAWRDLPLEFAYEQNSRGIGVADVADAVAGRRPHRASGDLAYHVLDVMESILDSGRTGRHVEVESRCERPAPMLPEPTFGRL